MTDSLREDVLLVEGHTFQLPVSRDLVLAKICLVCYESYPRVRTSANTLTRPTTPTADSWQDTRPHRRCSSATSSPNSTAEHVRKRKGRGVNSWHIIDTSDQSLARPTQSVRARQQLDLAALQFPEVFILARDERQCWAALGQRSWNIEAVVKATLTQCVFVNEPVDGVGQGLNSCGDGSATVRRLQLQGAETHYEWVKMLCLKQRQQTQHGKSCEYFMDAVGLIVLEGHGNILWRAMWLSH